MTDLSTPDPTPCGITREKVSCTRRAGHTGVHRVGRPLSTIRSEDDQVTVTCLGTNLLGLECLGKVVPVMEGTEVEPKEKWGVWLWCTECGRWAARPAPKPQTPPRRRRR